jgi:drug/metabolite transporter (DMT)-like permease
MENNLLIFLCILLWGVSTFLNRLSVERMSPFLMQVVGACVFCLFVPFMLRLGDVSNPLTYKWSPYSVALTATAAMISILANIFLYLSLKGSAQSGSTAMLISLYPVVTMPLSVVFLHEHLPILKILGIIAMIIGTILLSW